MTDENVDLDKQNDHEKRAQLRLETQAVQAYLKAINEGTVMDPEVLKRKREKLTAQILAAAEKGNYVKQLEWIEQRKKLEDLPDTSELMDKFIKVAASFGERKGITYPTWREVGVPAGVLASAGITR